jgi:prophage regulatory protein
MATSLLRERFCDIKEVCIAVGLTAPTIRKKARQGEFPRPALTGARARWRVSDVERWMANPAAWQKKKAPGTDRL